MCAKFEKDPAKDAVFIQQNITSLPLVFKVTSVLSDASGASVGNRTTNSTAQIGIEMSEGIFDRFLQIFQAIQWICRSVVDRCTRCITQNGGHFEKQ